MWVRTNSGDHTQWRTWPGCRLSSDGDRHLVEFAVVPVAATRVIPDSGIGSVANGPDRRGLSRRLAVDHHFDLRACLDALDFVPGPVIQARSPSHVLGAGRACEGAVDLACRQKLCLVILRRVCALAHQVVIT